jgi:hypothetical protein
MELKELDELLLARAIEHDSPTLLFRLGCEYLLSAKVIRPSPDTVIRRDVHAREQAQRETYDRLSHELTAQHCTELDALLGGRSTTPASRSRSARLQARLVLLNSPSNAQVRSSSRVDPIAVSAKISSSAPALA